MKISVITPFYNGNAYMGEYQKMMLSCEDRLLASNAKSGSDFSMEVILVNDSPGIPVAISAIYRQKENWIILENETNLGIHGSRVRGLAAAGGEYVVFLDQDDMLREDALLSFLEVASHQSEAVIVSNALFETKESTNLLYRTDYQKGLIGNISTYLCVGTQIVSPGQCAIRKDAIPEAWKTHILHQNGADDYFLWLLMLGEDAGFYYIDLPLYTHRYTGGNLSAETEITDTSTYEFLPWLKETGVLDGGEVTLLERMIRYKAAFRKATTVGKVLLSLWNLDIFINNLIFKKRTDTPYGFNR